MNSCWPTGRDPRHAPVRERWATLVEVDPDVVIDLHSSSGIYGGEPDGVGQAIFPTADVRAIASNACDRMTEVVSNAGYGSGHAYKRGNLLTGSGTKLARKVYQDLGASAFICEPTRSETKFDERINWNLRSAIELLDAFGMGLDG